ncbi:hypothetical protein Tco_0164901 [Tanacetum coccineum]
MKMKEMEMEEMDEMEMQEMQMEEMETEEVNGNEGNGGNGNGNGNGGEYGYNFRGFMPARECTYQEFLKCQPLNFNGTKGVVRLTRWFEKMETMCTYQEFLKCQPLNFNGTKGVVRLTRWFKKMETVFHISNCPEKYQVKYASCTLLNSALTW